jgi:tetratricopeptide (TPR) repeat protein
MISLRSYLAVGALGFIVSFATQAGTQTSSPSLVAVVRTATEGSAIAHAMVRIESAGLGPYETSDSGRFVFPLTVNLRVGHEATFRVDPSNNKKWVIVKPCDHYNGRVFSLPDVGGEPIEILAVPWGSPELKKLYAPGCIVEEMASRGPEIRAGRAPSSLSRNKGLPVFAAQTESRYFKESDKQPDGAHHFRVVEAVYRAQTSRNDPGLGSNNSSSDFLAEKAMELGLTVEDLTGMVSEWTISVENPYEKGLAAFYEGRYADASRYITESITFAKGDVLKRYVPLARAEYEQGHYASAEAALRRVFAVHSHDPLVLNNLGAVLHKRGNYVERMTPEERVAALRDFRNFGSVQHPIFSFDFKHREDYIAANEQYDREHPDKASFAPKGSAYAASLEARKKNPTITVVQVVGKTDVIPVQTRRKPKPVFTDVIPVQTHRKAKPVFTDVIPVQTRRKAKPVFVRVFVKVRGKDAYKLNPKLKRGA